jgi:hypothetical protein
MIEDFIPSYECKFGNIQDTLDLLNELFDLDYTLEDLNK